MKDPRNDKLAEMLVNYSCQVKKGDVVWIALKGVQTMDLGKSLIKKVNEAGAVPFWTVNDDSLARHFFTSFKDEQMKKYGLFIKSMAQKCDCFISIRGSANAFDLRDMPPDRMKSLKVNYLDPVFSKIITRKKRWVALRFPDDSMAQLAEQPQETFEDFYYDVCLVDYRKMSKALNPLVKLMEKTDKVRLTAKNTDLTFSIKGIPVIKCAGEQNVPDGEVFTAPVKNSVNGVITFNTPSLYESTVYNNIRLEFKNGKIIKADCDGETEKLNAILDTDRGARYVGELAIGVNPMIKEPMKDTLFDEKIDGSIHFTPGRCYEDASNGNKSAIHWDLVLIQRKDYGGGDIYFDDKLVRRNGKFVIPAMKGKITRRALGG